MTQLETVLEQLSREIDNLGRRIESLEAHENNYFSRLTIGSPVASPGAGDAVIENDLTVEGTITGTGLVTGGDNHDHDGGDGAAIPEAGLAAAVSAQLVTGGDNHDHSGGDGGTIPTGGIADNAIDDTKAGDRMPMLTRREGGSSTAWDTPGTTSRTPGAIKMQCGAIEWTGSSSTTGSVAVSFPQSFGNKPLVIVSLGGHTIAGVDDIWVANETSSGCTISFKASVAQSSVEFHWIAIGPE